MARSQVEEIKNRLSIVDVISEYVELKHAGKSYKGKSPFTNEKTPSFYVSPERGAYYCFSSQKGGDMFTFIQEMEGVDFKGALKILAEKAHVELTPEDPKVRDARETQYALLEEAAVYFFRAREDRPDINAYIEKRGVAFNTVLSWRVGYAKDEWRALRAHLTGKGFSDADMLRAGLIKTTDQGKEPYDVFRDRIMFPIMDTSGRVVAFSGRTLKTESGIPKYVNSPETELFQKSEILYGYDKARHGIRQYDFSLVVEGQFDLVLSHQAGYTNTVAVSGTALTKYHIALLSRLSQNVVLALDADRAGISAVKRSSIPLLEMGMNVKVAHMPDGKDPADIVREDPTELKHIVGASVHVIEFLLMVMKQNTKDERTYKLRVREELLPLLVSIDNRIDREHFETIVAEAIDTTKEGVHFEVERIGEALRLSATHTEHGGTQVPNPQNILGSKNGTQKENVYAGLRAYLALLTETHPHYATKMREEISRIEKVAGREGMLVEEHDQGAVFMLEERVEGMRDKQILEEVSDMLTRFAHLVARERLSELREQMKLAELERDHDQTLIILKETKEAEGLLQSNILLVNDENAPSR